MTVITPNLNFNYRSINNSSELTTPLSQSNRGRSPALVSSVTQPTTSTSSSENIPLSKYSSFPAWKADRAELFAKYAEAGDKAIVPRGAVIRSSAYSSSANPAEKLNHYSAMVNRGRSGATEQTDSPTTEPTTGGTANVLPWSEAQTREHFGNYFVYNMERMIGDIHRAENSIQRNQNSITFHELANASSNGENPESHTVINAANSSIDRAKELINKRLNELSTWAEKSGLPTEAAEFFAEYTGQYFGNEQTLDSLKAKYGTA